MRNQLIDWVWLQSSGVVINRLINHAINRNPADFGISEVDVLTNQSGTQSPGWRGRHSIS